MDVWRLRVSDDLYHVYFQCLELITRRQLIKVADSADLDGLYRAVLHPIVTRTRSGTATLAEALGVSEERVLDTSHDAAGPTQKSGLSRLVSIVHDALLETFIDLLRARESSMNFAKHQYSEDNPSGYFARAMKRTDLAPMRGFYYQPLQTSFQSHSRFP